MRNGLRVWRSEGAGATMKNAQLMEQYLIELEITKFNMKFMKFEVSAAGTNIKIPHNLGYLPLDIFTTRLSGNITFNYDLFDDKFLDITTTGAASFRGLIGRYKETQ
jgi:hypothetical protein